MIPDERHLMVDLGSLLEQVRERVLADTTLGLRPSQLRVIGAVPPEGISQSELADRVGMTKQGAGQFVAVLVEGGYLTAEPHPADRRARHVRVTRRGRDASRRLAGLLAAVERGWAEDVGQREYERFRATLRRLADVGLR